MKQSDIVWTALMKAADNIERCYEPIQSNHDIADILRDVAEQIAIMTTWGEDRKATKRGGVSPHVEWRLQK